MEAKGLLGTLDTSGAAAHKLVFDTSAGRYSIDGVKSDVDDRRAIRMADGRTTSVFDFDALRLGPSTVVSVRGKNPLVIVSKGDVSIATPLRLDGKPGADNGRGAGGGGGGGGGAVAIFSKGTLTVSSLISVNGGPGGVGNAHWGAIHGGDGGAGAVTLASAEQVELTGTISALTGGTASGSPGPVAVVGPTAYGAKATVNGVPAPDAPALHVMPGIMKDTLTIAGGSGGGGGGGTGLPEVVTPGYVKTKSPGGVAGPGGFGGGTGSYAVAGGAGGEGGFGLIGGGGGGGGGAYGGPGGAGGNGLTSGEPGFQGGHAVCPYFMAGGPGGAGGGPGGAGGGGGTASSGAGDPGANGGFGGGGGGGGGGADGCGLAPGLGGLGGQGGTGDLPGRSGSRGRWQLFGGQIRDASGVDFDASCLVADPTKLTPPGENNIDSPYPGAAGGTWQNGGGCDGISNYDGSAESIDLTDVTLTTNGVDNPGPSDKQLVANWVSEAPLPPAGSTCNPAVGGPGCPDLPDPSFVGFGVKVLFQVPTRQNNTPTNAVGGGCPRMPTGQVFDQHDHWLDGYHHFIGFDAVWDGTSWVHSAQIGTYDPSPDGAFFFTELGSDYGSGWQSADPAAVFGTNWNVTYGPGLEVSVTVDGVLSSADAVNCTTGVFNTVYAKAGDSIVNVKGLSTADRTVTLPVTVPLSLVPGFSDIMSIGGFIFFSDITEGNSTNNGIVGSALRANRSGVSFTTGQAGSDTLGDSPACPTPTFGGFLPMNPFVNPNVGCQYDDDNIPVPNFANPVGPWTVIDPGERGTFLIELWNTKYGLSA